MEQSKPSYYGIIPASVRYDKTIPAGAKVLYSELTALCNKEGYCWASNGYFAELYGVAKMTISVWIKSLSIAGHIKIDYNNIDKNNTYRKIYIGINENIDIPIEKPITPPIEKPITNITSLNNTSNISTFETFWALYDKKVGKENTLKQWNKLKVDDALLKIILSHVTKLKKTSEKKFRKDPERYLKNKCWNDEIMDERSQSKYQEL